MSEYTHIDTRPMVWVSRKIMTIFSILIFFDIGMMVTTIMAVTGAETADPRDIVQGAKIDFPPPGEQIQALEIGLAAFGLFFHILFALIFLGRVKKAKQTMDYASGTRLTEFVLYIVLPFLVIEVAGWAVCLGFQSLYAPVIKPRKLLACHYLGPDLVHFVHFVLLMLVLRAYYRMDPVAEPSPQYAGVPSAEDAHHSLPQDHGAPPSYEERESGHLIGKSTKTQPQHVEMSRMTTLPE
ncbi:uncharacterized protein NECHADRAFT_87002 [Fusarium vanettenii 77-13-4]|uniref:Uncharacterized protein n=1 Tax=Fusarium vanettenii (strain ATCC MYA-4622 / CBS 123669 / FGSC 9596 / NRRL 45880 / 77-13-4) TaxID=660122 RepID=C7ZMM8_FUSV7|nr:uncharacterized protein NECHADRAFT_87002 [Fusarium vanettenii 77-13-4]EEU34718.1 predicted protein [Fusarium vanettenii 77-13-4]